ncbi:uncharacterized protein BX664DRAFT_362071 [Halteromyces radiatus]|uniref:uncharacterized protein n=1 Tax=Halteromyces radiatus TaxID=101107 RepID=UPI00222009C1|nr:uncharacterized protein BX664DRAFT_362071 [Halteromyces radiatus]KAI8079939.1 hypothetical protein BX664DRAFT_362071 [Halteromyces radiatus]
MPFNQFDPISFNHIKHTFPLLDSDVSVENTIYYLSLLEQFQQLHHTFATHLDTFHARAELRYQAWIQGCQKRIDNTSSSIIIPPIDVAYMSHAHLVSPFRFYEDCQRMMPHMLNFPMPLKQIHFQRNAPNRESVQFWTSECAKGRDEPFILTIDDMNQQLPGYQECPLCKKCFKISSHDYGRWRTDPTVYLKCWYCDQEYNIHDAAVEQIVNDLSREKQPTEKESAWIRGTMLNNLGMIKKSVTDPGTESVIQRLRRTIGHSPPSSSSSSSINQTSSSSVSSSRAMIEFIEKSVRRKTTSMYDIEPILLRQLHFRALEQEYTSEEEKQKQNKIKDLAYAMNACYGNNPSPFSLDLIQAAKRQHKEGIRLLKEHWLLPDSMVLGIRRYKNFLLLINYHHHDQGGGMNVDSSEEEDDGYYLIGSRTTADVDVTWRTHMLFPNQYRQFTLRYLGRVMNHEDPIPHYQLEENDNIQRSSVRRYSTLLSRRRTRNHHSVSRVHPRPSFGLDYTHGSIVVDDPIDSISYYGDSDSNGSPMTKDIPELERKSAEIKRSTISKFKDI